MSTDTDSNSSTSRPSDEFVPWRKQGFDTSLQFSDGQSDSAISSSVASYTVRTETTSGIGSSFKALLSKYKKKTLTRGLRSMLKHKQYHHMNREQHIVALQEDSEVASMARSYSSHMNLLPYKANTKVELPNHVLGTFAAAAMSPFKPPSKLSAMVVESKFSPEPMESVVEVDSHRSSNDDDDSEDAQLKVTHVQTPSKRVTVHNISSLDMYASVLEEEDSESVSFYSKSDFDSSAPSSVPSQIVDEAGSSSYSSSCASSRGSNSTDSSTSDSRAVDCSFAAAMAPLEKNGCDEESFGEVSEDDADESNAIDDFHDAITTFDDESNGVHLIGISQILSESESSDDEIALNETNIVSDSSSTGESDSLFEDCADLSEDDFQCEPPIINTSTGKHHTGMIVVKSETAHVVPGATDGAISELATGEDGGENRSFDTSNNSGGMVDQSEEDISMLSFDTTVLAGNVSSQ